jgi:hypothetical protein
VDRKHLERRWRWLRAGAKARSAMRDDLSAAIAAADAEKIRALWSAGLQKPAREWDCSLSTSIHLHGSRSDASRALMELWPQDFGQGSALDRALAELEFNEPFVARLVELLPRRGAKASRAGQRLGRGFRALELARPGAAMVWMRRVAQASPQALVGICGFMARAGDENLLLAALDMAPSKTLLTQCEREALKSFSRGRYFHRQMSSLSEPTLARLVDASRPMDAAQALVFGAPCPALVRLARTKASAPKAQALADWVVEAMQNEACHARFAPRDEVFAWTHEPLLMSRLTLITQQADPAALALAARRVAKKWHWGDGATRELLLDVLLSSLPVDDARAAWTWARSLKKGPQTAGPRMAAALDERELRKTLPSHGPRGPAKRL